MIIADVLEVRMFENTYLYDVDVNGRTWHWKDVLKKDFVN